MLISSFSFAISIFKSKLNPLGLEYTDTKELQGHSKNKNYRVIGDYFRHVHRKPETKLYKESKWCKYKELEGKIEKDLEWAVRGNMLDLTGKNVAP